MKRIIYTLEYFKVRNESSSWQDFSDTGRSTGAYIIVYQCGTIEHGTHVRGPIAQSIAESEYNAACTTLMSLA